MLLSYDHNFEIFHKISWANSMNQYTSENKLKDKESVFLNLQFTKH
jgi:hypothetical protein